MDKKLPRLLIAFLVLLAGVQLLAAPAGAADKEMKEARKNAEKYREKLDKDPEDLESRYSLGVALITLEDWAEAEGVLAVYTEQRSDDPKGFFYLGQALQELDRCAGAVEAFETAATLDQDGELGVRGPALAQKGACLKDLGRHEGALEAYRAALDAGVKDETSLLMSMGIVHSKMGNNEKAQEVFARIAQEDPDNPAVQFNLGVLLLAAAKKSYDPNLFAQAAQAFARAAELDPRDANARFQAGEAWLMANEPAKAKPHLEGYLKMAPKGSHAAEAREYLTLVE